MRNVKIKMTKRIDLMHYKLNNDQNRPINFVFWPVAD